MISDHHLMFNSSVSILRFVVCDPCLAYYGQSVCWFNIGTIVGQSDYQPKKTFLKKLKKLDWLIWKLLCSNVLFMCFFKWVTPDLEIFKHVSLVKVMGGVHHLVLGCITCACVLSTDVVLGNVTKTNTICVCLLRASVPYISWLVSPARNIGCDMIQRPTWHHECQGQGSTQIKHYYWYKSWN